MPPRPTPGPNFLRAMHWIPIRAGVTILLLLLMSFVSLAADVVPVPKLAARVTDQHAAVGEIGQGDALGEVGAVGLGVVCHVVLP